MTPERFTLRSIAREVLGELNFEKGILYTLKALALSPAKAIKTYLHEDRTKLVKSSRFLFISVAIATFLTLEYVSLRTPGSSSTGTTAQTEEQVSPEITEKIGAKLLVRVRKLTTDYLNLMMLLSVPIFALITYLSFFKNGMNYAEHLVANTFIWGFITYLYIPVIPFLANAQFIFMIVATFYSVIVLYLLFKGTGRFILLKAILANLLGMFIFPLILALLILMGVVFNL